MSRITSEDVTVLLVEGVQHLNGESCDVTVDPVNRVAQITNPHDDALLAKRAVCAGIELALSIDDFSERHPQNVEVVQVPLAPIQPAFSALASPPETPILRSLHQQIQVRG